jgi:hypothetical protein
VGVEADHLTMVNAEKFSHFVAPKRGMDISAGTMAQRMVKSPAEIELIRHGAAVADVGGYAIRDTIREGLREIDVAMAGRDAMEAEIARRFPDAQAETRRYPEPELFSDDFGLLHRAGTHPVRGRGGRRQPEDLGGQRRRP